MKNKLVIIFILSATPFVQAMEQPRSALTNCLECADRNVTENCNALGFRTGNCTQEDLGCMCAASCGGFLAKNCLIYPRVNIPFGNSDDDVAVSARRHLASIVAACMR